ncbi:MAG: heavy metal translocating P-type ATPase [Clostridia bacterium]|nr:heavy metal translocating P-type ATPase [Clostridia bacterium]
MQEFDITGMSCAACQVRVEKAVSGIDNVESCSVNLLTNSMTVSGAATKEEIINAVEKAGYGAKAKGEKFERTVEKKPSLLPRLISSVFFLIILMYISMGHLMWNFPLPEFLTNNPLKLALSELILSTIILVINRKFFISGTKAIINRSPNMDTLVSLGSLSAFLYSLYELFPMSDMILNGDIHSAHNTLHNLYFESAAMILTLITVGKMLEAHSKGKTTNAIKSLIAMTPKTAIILKDGKEVTIPISEIKVGDIFIAKPASKIPADGEVIEGSAAIDESMLTGESIPRDVEIGSTVSAAAINKSGFIKCRATKVGEDTAFSKIIKMVEDASASKAPIARVADTVSGVFVPVVIGLAIITLIIWIALGFPFGIAIKRAVSVLVVSCPCALGLATPVAIMVGNGVAAKAGILFKNSTALENLSKAKIIALDKTGTITSGMPEVSDIVPFTKDNGYLLKLAYSLEKKSEHPLSIAIVKKAEESGIALLDSESFKNDVPGGVSAKIGNSTVYGGNYKFISSVCSVPENTLIDAKAEAENGKTPLFFAENDEFLGYICVRDSIKPDSKDAIANLKSMDIEVVMLTGDNEATAKYVASEVGISKIRSNIMPGEKESIIRQLKEKDKVIMVGDGINDAPSLTSSDIGIAIGQGTDVAIESADVVLTGSKLSDVVSAIKISKKTLKNIYENLFWAFCYNIIGIPLAAGAFIPSFGWDFGPMFAAAAMSVSSFLVVSNALRLNLIKLKKEKKKMEITMKIEGMMCTHCEARVKKCLEETSGVISAEVSHEKDMAKVICEETVTKEILKKAVEDQGYKVL